MAEIIETNEFDLPEELITNILTRLPIKSLLRYKSVSKNFHFIISSPYFAILHLKKSNSSHNNNNDNNSHLLIHHHLRFISFDFESFNSDCSSFIDVGTILKNKLGFARIIKRNFHFPNNQLFVIGSYDGLVCFKRHYFSLIYIWNPTTLKYRRIPLFKESLTNGDGEGWGFGGVTSGRDYKIVRIRRNYNTHNEKIIEIFSLLENCWTSSQEMMEGFGNRQHLSGLGVSVNNVIYWSYTAVYEFYNNIPYGLRWWIVGFDLVTHKLKRVPLPTWLICDFKSRPIMYVMEESLCACWESSYHIVVEVATFKEEGGTSSWIKLHQLSYDFLQRHLLHFSDRWLLNITTKNRFAVKDSRNRDTILFIDPAQESPEDVLRLGIPIDDRELIYNYKETLLSPYFTHPDPAIRLPLVLKQKPRKRERSIWGWCCWVTSRHA